MKKFLFSILALPIISIFGQVGVNTQTPHPSAALHIQGNSNGLLVPVLDTATGGLNTINNPAKGLIVCDTLSYTVPIFYIYDGDAWVLMNPLYASEGNKSTLSLSGGSPTITFSENVAVIDNFSVSGITTLEGVVEINNTLAVTGNVEFRNNVSFSESITIPQLEVSQNITGNKNIVANDTVKASVFEGFGVTPVGGIIMWSGTEIPPGWALCDGRVDQSTGRRTPDLRGRFIVGAGQYSSSNPLEKEFPNYRINETGGFNKYALSTAEIPSHNHSITYQTRNYTTGSTVGVTPNIEMTSRTDDGQSIGYTGGGGPHENRPPYYVLAFIMRVE